MKKHFFYFLVFTLFFLHSLPSYAYLGNWMGEEIEVLGQDPKSSEIYIKKKLKKDSVEQGPDNVFYYVYDDQAKLKAIYCETCNQEEKNLLKESELESFYTPQDNQNFKNPIALIQVADSNFKEKLKNLLKPIVSELSPNKACSVNNYYLYNAGNHNYRGAYTYFVQNKKIKSSYNKFFLGFLPDPVCNNSKQKVQTHWFKMKGMVVTVIKNRQTWEDGLGCQLNQDYLIINSLEKNNIFLDPEDQEKTCY